jgi:hypothetical protein
MRRYFAFWGGGVCAIFQSVPEDFINQQTAFRQRV